MEVKLCKDCKHLAGTNKDVCIRPIPIVGIDYVNGTSTKSLCRFAHEERTLKNYEGNDYCGIEAKFFTPKEAE